nr:hypothetical protein [Tanacetum cinerariifolium]
MWQLTNGSINTLWTHISENGFDSTYTIWDKHGESLPPPPQPPSLEYDNMASFLDKIIRPENASTQTTGPQPTQTTGPQPTQTTGPQPMGPRIDNEFKVLFSRATDKLYQKSQHTAKWMTGHSTRKSKENGKMNHPVDAKACTDFKMKVVLLWTINDFPARSSLFWWSGKGYLACLTCNKDPPNAKVRGEIVFVGHRKFLRIKLTMRMKRAFSEAILCGPVYMRWMYPLERYMKKLKNYVRNQAKPEGSIVEGYVSEEALTFCSHYLKDVERRFNCPGRNGFGLNPTDTFQIRQKSMENDPRCSPEYELFSLAFRPESNANSYPACVVNGVMFLVHDRDIHRTTQSSGVATLGPNGEMFYEDNQDVIHSNSSDVALFANLGDLDYTSLSTNDESTEVDASPDNEVPDEENADFIGDEDDVVPHVLEDDDQDDDMACVAPRSHGGDAGGDPLDDRRPRLLPHQCKGFGKRGESKHKALKKAFKQNGYHKLEIVFEAKDQKTFKPVGRYGANFSSYTYFDLQPHLNDETVIKINGEDKTVGSLVRVGLQRDFARRYSDNKFLDPDLYTPPVFPGSIFTPGGPSSSSPAPSSTPLRLGNYYTPTFDPETSQSGELEDNGSDDGNHEYDVDIYDDE